MPDQKGSTPVQMLPESVVFLTSVIFFPQRIMTLSSRPLWEWNLTVNLSHSYSPGPYTSSIDPDTPPNKERKVDGTFTEKFASRSLSVQMEKGQSPSAWVSIPSSASAQVFAVKGVTVTFDSW